MKVVFYDHDGNGRHKYARMLYAVHVDRLVGMKKK